MTFPERKKFLFVLGAALLLKAALYAYVMVAAPQTIFENDTPGYLDPGMMLVSQGRFGIYNQNHHYMPEIYRTPGYPLFLGVLHGLLKIPLPAIVLLQVGLTVLAAFLTYKTAMAIDRRLGLLSFAIVAFDPPVTIYSLMLLTESLFLLLMALFLRVTVAYVQGKRIRDIVLAAVILAAAVYVRPVAYFLALAVTVVIVFAKRPGGIFKAVAHAALFATLVYSLIGVWHLRNYRQVQDPTFSSITEATICSQYATGMIHSYARDDHLRGERNSPAVYYIGKTAQSLGALMTDPGSLKYFGSRILKVAGKVFGYPWMAFWLSGLLMGLARMKRDPAFYLLAAVTAYFCCVTVVGTMLGSCARFRVPMMPFIAILSAQGWIWLRGRWVRGKT